jgi:hypothetical protein
MGCAEAKKPGRMPGLLRWDLDTLILALSPRRCNTVATGMANYAFDPTRLVAEWPIPGLSTADRQKISSVLLRAHAAVLRTAWDDVYRFVKPMQEAFSGIAGVLFNAKLLTVKLLEEHLRLLVSEAAIAGGWLGPYAYTANEEAPTEIFPGGFGHAAVWDRMNDTFPMLFAAEIAEWKSELLEAEADQNAPAQNSTFEHADDYSWVRFRCEEYRLGPVAAAIVECLHKAYQRGQPEMTGARLLEIAGAPGTSHLRSFFRSNGAWKTLVVSPQRGRYRLNLP